MEDLQQAAWVWPSDGVYAEILAVPGHRMLLNWGFSHPSFIAALLAGHYAHPKKDTFQSKALRTGLWIKMWITSTSTTFGHTSSCHFANINHCKQLLLWWGGLCLALMWVIKEVEARSPTLSQQVLCKNLLTTLKWQLRDQSNRTESALHCTGLHRGVIWMK